MRRCKEAHQKPINHLITILFHRKFLHPRQTAGVRLARHDDAFVITRDIILERMLAVAYIDFELIEADA